MGAQRITNADTPLQEGDQAPACSLIRAWKVQRVPPSLKVAGGATSYTRRFQLIAALAMGL